MATLPNVTGLVTRFKGDDVVAAVGTQTDTWPESSGLGHAAAVQPTLDNQPLVVSALGHKGLEFDGTNDYMVIPEGSGRTILNAKTGFTIITVVVPKGTATGEHTMFHLSTGTGTGTVRANLRTTTTTRRPRVIGRALDSQTGSSGVTSPSTIFHVADVGTVTTGWINWTDGSGAVYHDGGVAAATATGFPTGTTENVNSLVGTIGATGTGGAYFIGVILEILVYDRALTADSDRGLIHSYVQDEYGIVVGDYTAPVTAGAKVLDKWNGSALVRQTTEHWNGTALSTRIFDI